MRDDGREELLDVLGLGVVAPVHERPRARRALEREAAAHRRAERDELDGARRADQRDDPALDDRVDVHVVDRLLQLEHVGERDDRAQRVERMPAALVLDDPQLLVLVGIAERRAQEEAIELGLGQRERALLLDRVLGRDAGRTAPAADASCRRR